MRWITGAFVNNGITKGSDGLHMGEYEESKPCVITGYFNNDYYAEKIYCDGFKSDGVKDRIKELLPIGKKARFKKCRPICREEHRNMCPHDGSCYGIIFHNNGLYHEFTACMINFKEIEEE